MGASSFVIHLPGRLRAFYRSTWDYKRRWFFEHVLKRLPWLVVPIRLPFGAWWLGQYEYSTHLAMTCGYELPESAFVQRSLGEGMTVVDVGANRGYYVMLASKAVGRSGRVVAFEPSPRDLRFLRANLLVNACRNVKVVPVALGKQAGEATLFVPKSYHSGNNCLKSSPNQWPGYSIKVPVRTLDQWIRANAVSHVDFMKIDIEGGELETFQGAIGLLSQKPRPVILCELIDDHTRLWGHEVSETVAFLRNLGFLWFCLTPNGSLYPMPEDKSQFPALTSELAYMTNFAAVPEERLSEICSGIRSESADGQ
jgi:FkbM family methyltransferase